MKRILVIGAGSRIAREFSIEALKRGYRVILSARSNVQTNKCIADLVVRSGQQQIKGFTMNLADANTLTSALSELSAEGPWHGVFIASGLMPPESAMAADSSQFIQMAMVNYAGPVACIEALLSQIENAPDTFLSCLTSVAGDRGRPSNFRYGSSKAALSTYLEGLAASRTDRLLIQDVKLGPVDTPMNSAVAKAPFMISPTRAARAIWSAIEHRQRKAYVPKKWQFIMLAIRLLPYPIFRRLPL